jgi:hypothetical protein
MTKDEALRMALEALEAHADIGIKSDKAITAIKEALVNVATNDTSQERVDEIQKQRHEQEPFAYVNVEKRRLEFAHDYVKWDTPTTIKLDKIPLYTTPPQRTWVGLTAGEILDALISVDEKTVRLPSLLGQVACAIEAKLKEKNT